MFWLCLAVEFNSNKYENIHRNIFIRILYGKPYTQPFSTDSFFRVRSLPTNFSGFENSGFRHFLWSFRITDYCSLLNSSVFFGDPVSCLPHLHGKMASWTKKWRINLRYMSSVMTMTMQICFSWNNLKH
jgi:hypothetical protein